MSKPEPHVVWPRSNDLSAPLWSAHVNEREARTVNDELGQGECWKARKNVPKGRITNLMRKSKARTKTAARNPHADTRRKFRNKVMVPWFGGTLIWIQVSVLSSTSVVNLAHMSIEYAYYWLTASVVLILAFVASSSLNLERAPEIGDDKSDALLAGYDAARLVVIRKWLRIGASVGAALATVVSWMGAAGYLYDSHIATVEPLERQGIVSGAVLILVLGLLIVFTSATLSLSLWEKPLGVLGTKDRFPRAKFALRALGAPKEQSFIERWSLSLLVLFISAFDTLVLLIAFTLWYKLDVEEPPSTFLIFFGGFLGLNSIIVGCWLICNGIVLSRLVTSKSPIRSQGQLNRWRAGSALAFLIAMVLLGWWLSDAPEPIILWLAFGTSILLCALTSYRRVGRMQLNVGMRASILGLPYSWEKQKDDKSVEELLAELRAKERRTTYSTLKGHGRKVATGFRRSRPYL